MSGVENSAAVASTVARPAKTVLVTLGLATFLGHMLVAGNYGYFRDELYYLADGHHLQAGYVDQPLLIGWLAALLRVTIGDGLVAIHIIPALAAALIVVLSALMARELGGDRFAQLLAGVAALFCVDYMATGSLFSMDVIDQLWWTLAGLLLIRMLRLDLPRLWLVVGFVVAVGLLTKLTILFFALGLILALLVTSQRRQLMTPWPWLAGGIAFLGLAPYLVWNVLNGWPTVEFWRHYPGVGTSPLDFLGAQIVQMNPVALPLAVLGLAFYFRRTGERYRLLGWTFVFAYLILIIIGTKPYFLAPAYPILFAAGAVVVERAKLTRWLAWIRPTYAALLGLVGLLLAPAAMPILPPSVVATSYGPLNQVLSDRLGWDSLTETVELVYSGLSLDERTKACVLTSNYGEAGALQQLGATGRLPPVISRHNNYFIWGPGTCSGEVLILVGFSATELQQMPAGYSFTIPATETCQYCISYESNLPIAVVLGPPGTSLPKLWTSLKYFD